jgi:hypothetical protein
MEEKKIQSMHLSNPQALFPNSVSVLALSNRAHRICPLAAK